MSDEQEQQAKDLLQETVWDHSEVAWIGFKENEVRTEPCAMLTHAVAISPNPFPRGVPVAFPGRVKVSAKRLLNAYQMLEECYYEPTQYHRTLTLETIEKESVKNRVPRIVRWLRIKNTTSML